MAFIKKTWVDRLVQYPMRRILTKSDGTEEVVTVARDEGTVFETGDPFNAQTMNDLEDRIDQALENVATTPKIYETEEDMYADIDNILPGEVVFTEDDEEVPEDKGDTIPVGVIQPFAGSTIPEGYLLCDGRAVSRTSYAELFTAIGTTWGAGDGSTTFNIPDLREVAPVGVGQSERTEDSHDVFALGEFKDDQMQNHTHSYTPPVGSHRAADDGASPWRAGVGSSTNTGANSGRKGTVTRGKRIGVNYIIKYRMVNGYINDHINASHVDFDNTDLPTTETDLQGAVSELYTDLTVLKGRTVWTNPNPTVAFSSQTVDFNTNDYEYYEVYYLRYIGASNSVHCSKSFNGIGVELYGGSAIRDCSISNNVLSIPNTDGGDNTLLVPLKIVLY